MQLNFHSFLVCCLTFQYALAYMLVKPSFIPYCTTRDKCQLACSCQYEENCNLLEMDEATRTAILFYHNQNRNIQTAAEPQPGGLSMLKYDLQLEEISKCWAARCDEQYSECFMTPTYPETSQTIGRIDLEEGQDPNNLLWVRMINSWLGEAKSLTIETLNSIPAGEAGESLHNYAQIMSDRVLSLGCAWSALNMSLTFVCTYGPKGPLQGESIYKAGKPCSMCPPFYVCDYVKPFDRLCKEAIPTTPPPLPSPQRGYQNNLQSIETESPPEYPIPQLPPRPQQPPTYFVDPLPSLPAPKQYPQYLPPAKQAPVPPPGAYQDNSLSQSFPPPLPPLPVMEHDQQVPEQSASEMSPPPLPHPMQPLPEIPMVSSVTEPSLQTTETTEEETEFPIRKAEYPHQKSSTYTSEGKSDLLCLIFGIITILIV